MVFYKLFKNLFFVSIWLVMPPHSWGSFSEIKSKSLKPVLSQELLALSSALTETVFTSAPCS